MTPDISGPGTAFLAGLVTSLHCVGMCGPLICTLMPGGARPEGPAAAALYHGSRVFSYTLIGLLAGALGLAGLGWAESFQAHAGRYFPWLLIGFFLAVGLRLDQRIPKPAWLTRPFQRVSRMAGNRRSPLLAAGLLGLLTPLIPCGPLYLVFGLALMSQSPAQGAEFTLCFALGTIPLLLLLQAGWWRWGGRFQPRHLQNAQRILALGAAFIILLRVLWLETGEGGFLCG